MSAGLTSRKHRRNKHAVRRQRRPIVLRVEPLEDRRLLSADLADPFDGQTIRPMALNSRAYIDVTFSDTGSGLNVADISDAEAEFTLGGAAAMGVEINGAPTLVDGTTYRYTFFGSFGIGPVTVDFVAESFSDMDGNLNAAETETFSVGIAFMPNSGGDEETGGTTSDVAGDRVLKAGFVCGYDSTRHDRFFNFETEPVRSANFLYSHHDLSGIAWRLNYRNAPVLISPQHYIFGGHVTVSTNTAIRFMNRDGDVKTFATVELTPIPGSDLQVGKLNRPLTPEDKIRHYPLLSSVAEAHAGREILFFKREMQAGKSWTTGLKLFNGLPGALEVNPHFLPDGSSVDGAYSVPGDSGNPSFVDSDGKLALVGIHTDNGQDQLIFPFIDEINAILAKEGYMLEILMDQGIVAGPNSLFFGGPALEGQPPFSLVGETVSQKREIAIHNFAPADETIWLATSHPFFRPDLASVLVPAEGSVTVGISFDSDTFGEHSGTLLLEGEGTTTSIGLEGHHRPETFSQLDDLLPDRFASNCVWGDYDGDGDLDVVCSRPAGPAGAPPAKVSIYRNDGHDSFTAIDPAFEGVTGPYAWGDYDGDGDLDLVVTGATDDDLLGGLTETRIYRNDGNDTFFQTATDIQGISQGQVAWVDFDGDGDLDLHLAGTLSGGSGRPISQLYVNEASGQFVARDVSFLPIRAPDVSWGDYDGDGDPDLLTVGLDRQWVHRNIIYRNDGDGSFHEIQGALDGLTRTHGWADFDDDGDLDVLPAAYLTTSDPNDPAPVTVFLNVGDSKFQEIETNLPKATGGVYWGDHDKDGDLDAFLWGQIRDRGCSVLVNRVYRNDGDGKFVDAKVPLLRTAWLNSLVGQDVRWGDYDGDRNLDLLMDGLVFRNNATYDAPPLPDGQTTINEPEHDTLSPQPGDANRDLRFDQHDIVQVLQSAKYLTGDTATFDEGDWNGDQVFDQLDIVAALQTGNYLQGNYAALAKREPAKVTDDMIAELFGAF